MSRCDEKKDLATERYSDYEIGDRLESPNGSKPGYMRRLSQIVRCRRPRCFAAKCRRFIALAFIGFVLVASWVPLIEDRKSSAGNKEHFADASGQRSHARLNEDFVVRQPHENPNSARANNHLLNAGLSRERFNAALAAGLIDPSKIELKGDLNADGTSSTAQPTVPASSLPRERLIVLSGPPTTGENPAPEKQMPPPLISNPVVAKPATTPLEDPTEQIGVVAFLASRMNQVVAEPPRHPDAVESIASIPSSGNREKRREGSAPTEKKHSARYFRMSRIGSVNTASGWESKSRKSRLASGVKPDGTADRKTDLHDSQTPDLSENLQRFASDFVRANQGDNVAEQHRFFADSVHFYDEGNLSLASVEAATRRHHRDQQSKRSEIVEPAASKGPVNGGFFEIEQPVRWTQSQGKQVTRGRSVLRLRVVPVDRGGWKITSIDEIKK